jgi:hypothetical protein
MPLTHLHAGDGPQIALSQEAHVPWPLSLRATSGSPDDLRQRLAWDEQRESRGAVGARLLCGKATAPRSWFLRLLPRVLARASVRAAANDGSGIRVRRPSQGAMRIRAGVAPAAARLESFRYGPGCDFACAISDPESSPQPHRDVRKRSSARILRQRDLDRSRHHVISAGVAIEAPRPPWRCSAALLRAVGHWDFVWDYAHLRGA